MKNVTRSVQAIFKTKGFNDLIEDLTKTETSPGIRNLEVTPIQGTWKKELEPSFIIHHPDMTDAHAAALAPVLGFGKQPGSRCSYQRDCLRSGCAQQPIDRLWLGDWP
jgi:hypothetical protein